MPGPDIGAVFEATLARQEQLGLLRFLDLRLGRRRQVDADRPAASRGRADLRGPTGRAGSGQPAARHQRGEAIDFALLLDGLEAEREQGITIDVAYRYFTTDRRKFIVADTPGHEQYTRNMATGAFDRRSGGPAGRRPARRPGPDPPARLHRRPAGHPRGGAGGQQDGPGRLGPGPVPGRSRPSSGALRTGSGCPG